MWLTGLEPASSYQLLVGSGPTEITTAFSTLPVALGGRVTRLVTGECEGPELRSSGERVAVLWIRAGSAFRNVICLRESRDGGRTWGRIEEVSPVEYALEPELVYLEGGTCLGWLSQNRELLLTRYRPGGSRSWQPAVSIPSGGVLPPLAMCAADDRLGAWVLTSVTLPDGTMRGRLLRWRLGPGGVARLEDDSRNGSLPPAEYLRVLQTSAGLLALGTETDRGPVRSLLPARPDARWTPLLSVGGQSGRVRERFLDVAERAGQLLVAQEQVTSILLHSSSDGGATFQLAANLGATRANGLFLRPALTATADRFVLAAFEYRLPFEASLRILSSRDGRSWEESTVVALDPLNPVAKLRSVVAGDRLLVLLGAERDWGLGLVSVPTAALLRR